MTNQVTANIGNSSQVAAVQQTPVESSSFIIRCTNQSQSFFGDIFRKIIVEKPQNSVTIRDIKIATAQELNFPIESLSVIINQSIPGNNTFIPDYIPHIH